MRRNRFVPYGSRNRRLPSRRQFLRFASALAVGGATGLSLSCNSAGSSREGGSPGDGYDVVIVGGGIAGLTAAWLLQDHRVLLLEKEEAAGGRIISGEWEGLHYAKGTEYIGPPEGDLAEWFGELGVTPVAVPPPTGAIAYQGEIHSGEEILGFLPSQAARDDYERLGNALEELAGYGIEEAVFEGEGDLEELAELDEVSVAEWLASEGFQSLVRQLVDVENRGLFGCANRDLSLLFNVPEMVWNLYDPNETESSEVYTFERGMIEVVWAIEESLGARVRRGAEVTAVEVRQDGQVDVTYQQGDTATTVRSSAVILATPAPITARVVRAGLSPAVARTLAAIPYAPYVTINLFLSERVWHEAWSMASLDDSFVTIYDAIRTQVAGDYTEKGILGLYVAPEDAGDTALLARSDEQLLERALSDLEKYDPDIRAKVLGHDIQRFPYAFPVFHPGYGEVLETLNGDYSVTGPLFLAGDYMVYATFDGAVISGLRAYEAVQEYL